MAMLPAHFEPDKVSEIYRVAYEERAKDAKLWRDEHGVAPSASDEHRVGLLLVDVQNTFCIPEFELFVAGRSGMEAVEDNTRLCRFIYANLSSITRIHATLDTHTAMQIFHSVFLVDDAGNHPEPMTAVSLEDVESGRWKVNPRVSVELGVDQAYLIHYCRSLSRYGLYALMVWPYHAMLGGVGHALVSAVEEALFFHNMVRSSQTSFEVKGVHPLTENYSVLRPEVLHDARGEKLVGLKGSAGAGAGDGAGINGGGANRRAPRLRRSHRGRASEEPLRRVDGGGSAHRDPKTRPGARRESVSSRGLQLSGRGPRRRGFHRPGGGRLSRLRVRPVCGSPTSILGLSGGLFSAAARPGQRPAPPFGAAVGFAIASCPKTTNELKTGAPGPFRSSSTCGEPQIWGVSETMSAIRVPRTRRENTVQQRDATLPGGDLDPGPGPPHGPERASWLRRGSPGLDSGPLGRPLFRRCTALSATRSPPLAQTWHSKIEIRDQNRK